MSETSTQKDLKNLKSQLVDTILISGTPIGILVFLISLFPFELSSITLDTLLSFLSLSALLVIYFFRDKLSSEFKTNVIILMLYSLFASELFLEGLDNNDVILLVLIPFLSILFYSFRVTLIFYSLCIGTYLLLGFLFTAGIIETPAGGYTETSFVKWLENALILTVVTFVITLFLYRFDKTIANLLLDLKHQNEDLQQRESILTEITRNIPRTYLSIIDRDFKVQFTEGSEFHRRNLNPVNFRGQKVSDIYAVYGNDIKETILSKYEETMSGSPKVFEIQIGEEHRQYKTIPLYGNNNEVISLLSVAENITDSIKTQQLLEENLNEKNVLLQEIHHRVKNNLAVVSGLLSLQSYNIDDQNSKFILKKSTNRIMSIAKVHEMLYESKNFNKIPFNRYIVELSSIILDSMNNDEKIIDFDSEINVEFVSINHGVPLGIIFNELITNSVKYGFDDSQEKSIKILVEQKNDRFLVTYEDSGTGIDDFEAASTKSLGFTLIKSLLAQIEAEFEYDTTDKFKLAFSFPADSVETQIPALA